MTIRKVNSRNCKQYCMLGVYKSCTQLERAKPKNTFFDQCYRGREASKVFATNFLEEPFYDTKVEPSRWSFQAIKLFVSFILLFTVYLVSIHPFLWPTQVQNSQYPSGICIWDHLYSFSVITSVVFFQDLK